MIISKNIIDRYPFFSNILEYSAKHFDIGTTVFHLIASSEDKTAPKLIEELCKIPEAKPISPNTNGETPLHLANQPETLNVLCDYATAEELNMQNDLGETALHGYSGTFGQRVKILVERGANPFIKSNKGLTAFENIYYFYKSYLANPEKPLEVEIRGENELQTLENINFYEHFKTIQDVLSIIALNALRINKSLTEYGISDEELPSLIIHKTEKIIAFPADHNANMYDDLYDYSKSLEEAAESGIKALEITELMGS